MTIKPQQRGIKMNTDGAEMVPVQDQLPGVLALAALSEAEFEMRLDQLKAGQNRIERIQKEIMTEGVDYGIIPGIGNKPTLLKPGAEKLCLLYRLVPSFENNEIYGDDISTPAILVRSKCKLHLGSTDGPVVGEGAAACSNFEKKYRYRRGERTCPDCGKTGTIIKGRAEFGGGWLCWSKKGGCDHKWGDGSPEIETQVVGDVINQDPYEQMNTIVKMALKRAYIDAALRATATSGLFTQDVGENGSGPEWDDNPPAKSRSKRSRPMKTSRPVSVPVIERLHLLIHTRTKSHAWAATLLHCNIMPPDGWVEPYGVEQARTSMAWLTEDQARYIERELLHYKPATEQMNREPGVEDSSEMNEEDNRN